MKIAYIHGFKFPPMSGGSVHAFQLSSNFIKKGNEVYSGLFSLRPQKLKDIFVELKSSDVLYIRTDGYFHNEILNIYKLLKKNIPILWEINAPLEETLYFNTKNNGFKKFNLYHNNIQKKILARFADGAVCVSKENKDYSERFLKIENSFLVPNGSDPEMFSPDKKRDHLFAEYEDYFKILWAGSAKYPWQGLEIIQQVARKLIDKKIIFIIITNKKDCRVNFDNKNIILINERQYLEMPEYFASVDLALNLYNNLSWSKWGFHYSPLKLFDYMSSGLPVIATSLGQIKDVISPGKNGLLTNNDINDIVEKIIYIKDNPSEAKKIGKNARETIVDYYNWDRAGDEILKIMSSYL